MPKTARRKASQAAYMKAYNKKRREEAKNKGLCTRCCKKEAAKGKTKCIRCLEHMKEKREKAKAQDNVCLKCFKQKPDSEFISLHSRREERTTMCKSCRDKEHEYQFSDRCAVHRQRMKFNAIRAKQECSMCGEDDPDVLEADHIKERGKKLKKLSNHKHWCTRPEKEFNDELEKIDWKCGFCHQLKTKSEWNEKEISRKQAIVNEYKLQVGKCCACCSRPVTLETCVAFDFDHKDPQTKKYNISKLVRKKEFDDKFLPEAHKCRIVCRNCHKKITKKQRQTARHQKPFV